MRACFYLGSWKTPSCNIRSINLIVHYLEPKLGKTLLINETSANGLFNLLRFSAKEDIPIVCVEETYKCFANVLSASKNTSGHSTFNMDSFVNYTMSTTGVRSKEAKPSVSVHRQQRSLCRVLHHIDVSGKKYAQNS